MTTSILNNKLPINSLKYLTKIFLLIPLKYLSLTKTAKETPKLQKYKSNFIEKNKFFNQTRYGESKHLGNQALSALSKTQNIWRKPSTNFIGGQEVIVMKKERILNLSNFVILDYHETSQNDKTCKSEIEEEKNIFRIKPPKNVVAFIKKRNLSHLNQKGQNHLDESYNINNIRKSPKRIFSPLQGIKRINISCEIKRNKEQQPSQIKFRNYDLQKIQNISPDIRQISPSFRNKRISPYRTYRSYKPEQK